MYHSDYPMSISKEID
jgi:hypothetical protein